MAPLVLFDLDGTLVDVFKYHVSSYMDMFKTIYGVEVKESNLTKKFGLPQRDVITRLLKEKNVKEKTINKKLEQAVETYFSNLKEKIPEGDETLLPGVKPLLKKLLSEDYTLGLITGNTPKVGKLIISKTNLYKLLLVKAFADTTIKKREDLIEKAVTTAKNKYFATENDQVIIFGDSTYDLKAAKKTGYTGIGVATGYTKKEDLLKESKYVLENLKDTPNILKLVKNIQNL